jgi:hypothetical protein
MPQPPKQTFAPKPKLNVNAGATGPVEAHNGIISELMEEREQPAPASPAAPKIGRPRKPDKVKKTFHITRGDAVIHEIRLLLAQKAGFVVKDESEVAEVAFKFLQNAIHDPEQFEAILAQFKTNQAASKQSIK